MSKTIYYEDETDLNGQRWTARIMDFCVGLMVASAINEMHSAYAFFVERRDMMRNTAKQCCNMAFKEARHTQQLIKSVMKCEKFWNDYSDTIIDIAAADIKSFRLSVKQTMIDANVTDAEMYSYIETARVLLCMTSNQYKGIVERAKKKFGRNYSNVFSEYNVDKIKYWWEAMCEIFYKSCNIGIVVNLENEETISVFDKMCDKFARGEYIQECMKLAKANNPDFIENSIVVLN